MHTIGTIVYVGLYDFYGRVVDVQPVSDGNPEIRYSVQPIASIEGEDYSMHSPFTGLRGYHLDEEPVTFENLEKARAEELAHINEQYDAILKLLFPN